MNGNERPQYKYIDEFTFIGLLFDIICFYANLLKIFLQVSTHKVLSRNTVKKSNDMRLGSHSSAVLYKTHELL